MIPAPDWPRYVSDCKRAGLTLKALSAAVGYRRESLRRLVRGEIREISYRRGRTLELIWEATHRACLYDIPHYLPASPGGDQTAELVPEIYSLVRMGMSKTTIARRIVADTTTLDRICSRGIAGPRLAERLRDLWQRCESAGLPKLMQR